MNIYITLDYELFSSSVPGSVKNCIVRPMSELCKIADKYGIKYVIFVDAAYLLCLHRSKAKSQKISNDYATIVENIKLLSRLGHDIQLHFHPQWIYTEWNENSESWTMDTKHFKMSDMPSKEVYKNFSEAKLLLDSIIERPSFAFRACGYCLESFSDYISLFENNKISVDSSVLRYCHVKSPVHEYDYRIVPKENIYRFSNGVTLRNDEGKFLEYSIYTQKFNFIEYWIRVWPLMKSVRTKFIFGDGKPLQDYAKKHSRFKSFIASKRIPASIDGQKSLLLPSLLQRALKNKVEDFVVCGHPKNISDVSLKALDYFIGNAKKNNAFCTFKRK